MSYSNQFFSSLNLNHESRAEIKEASSLLGIPVSRMKYYNDNNVLPSGNDLDAICKFYGISKLYLALKMGRLDHKISNLIQDKAEDIEKIILENEYKEDEKTSLVPTFNSKLGKLYNVDCLQLLKSLENDSVDMVFADPPFNLSKLYPSGMDDNLKEEEYIRWSEEWLEECIRVLKWGGSLFLWNLPSWNSRFSYFLHSKLNFKHWVAVDIKSSLPIQGRLYPSHYSLLYFVKGSKATKFEPDRLPAPTCPKCYGDLKDYGGYKSKMNPNGVNLTDVWTDIPPVRHAKYKKRKGANELSVKLLDRIIEMSTNEGDVVLDPFGGSGTTYIVSELKGRRWLGSEIDPCDIIIERFNNIHFDKDNLDSIRNNINYLFPPSIRKEREKRGLWTAESVSDERSSKSKEGTEGNLFSFLD